MASSPSAAFLRLRAFIAERMRMRPIDQPLTLMELLGRSSPATARDVARRILGENVTQIEYYTERVKPMVGRVLNGKGIKRTSSRTMPSRIEVLGDRKRIQAECFTFPETTMRRQ